jgi:hypothetical protein
MLQRGEIPTVMLAPNDLVYVKSLNPSYRKIGESIQQGITYSIYEFNPGAPRRIINKEKDRHRQTRHPRLN